MMTRFRFGLAIVAATAVVLISSGRWSLRAQVHGPAAEKATDPAAKLTGPVGAVSVQDALLRPFSWPFADDTPLQDVAEHLRKGLAAPVVLDRAALARRKLTPEATVRLQLEGVRLKTGLKLLLDQVGLTYRVVPEDNLLILTDAEGADDPSERILAEIKSLHRDIHDIQDEVAELRKDLGPEEESGPALRKPTIIEEVPDPANKDMPAEKPARSRPGM